MTPNSQFLIPNSKSDLTSLVFRSAEEVACDECAASLAAAMGDLDPFACPAGSTNTIFEHVFYTGTTNAPFAYPSDTADTAVLVVTVTGVGSGELRIGDRVVPLLARPRPRLLMGANGAPDPTATTLRVPVPKDRTHRRIHRFMEHETEVTLPVGEGADDLTCAWNETDDVEVWNRPPRSARIAGRFDPRDERPVTYTLSHPRYLFGETEYEQNVRYCPKPSDDDPTDYLGVGIPFPDECWCCHWQTCDTNCTCGCDTCGRWTDTLTNDCDFARTNYPHMSDVLKIRTPREYSDFIALPVPTGVRNCCPCPEHHTNGVSLAYARRVSVVDPTGSAFRSSDKPVTVRVAATEPSYEPGDGRALFATNGVPMESNDYTCLGVGVSAYGVDLAALNAKNRQFGLPVVVNTNLDEAVLIRLDVNVLLRGGRIRLSVEDATAPLEVWGPSSIRGEWAKFADADTSLDVTMAEWRRMTGHADDGGVPSVNVRLLVPRVGKATLVLHYWNVIDGKFVEDEARQVVTAINPPLLPDYNRDGKADMEDWDKITQGRQVWFWTNQDTWKGDDAFDEEFWVRPNAEDLIVNGRYDAMNFLPLSIDLSTLAAAWGTSQFRYELLADGRELTQARMCIVEVARSSIGTVFDGDCLALDGTPMRNAEVAPIGTATNLSAEVVRGAGTHAVVMEFPEAFRNRSLRLRVLRKADGAVFFSQAVKLNASPVDDMYGWVNLRRAIGIGEGDLTRLMTPGWPVAEHGQGNLVFAHGYNVSKDEARTWARGVFKKLWLAGLDTGFVAVTWFGNEGQVGWGSKVVTFNYYGNVQNAFETAPHYKLAMDVLTCRTVPIQRKTNSDGYTVRLFSALIKGQDNCLRQ